MRELNFHKLFVVILLIAIIIITLTFHNKLDNYNKYYPEQTQTPNIQQQQQPVLQQQQQQQPPIINPSQLIREYDYRTFYDPLIPPKKIDDYNLPVIPIPTRGNASGYKKMGYLTNRTAPNDDPYKFLILMGRMTYPGSNYYDYYVIEKGTNGLNTLKFDLYNKHRELASGDVIKIKELNHDYHVVIDRNAGFEYNPYLI